jgi:5-(carboxyamino)imidazole ribonucleotide synthase
MSALGTAPTEEPRAEPPRPPLASAVVAMVGAGQLARMTHQAAIALGVELRVLAGRDDEPAVRAGASYRLGSPDRLDDLRALAAGADVVTFDHEGIDPEHLAALEAEGVPLAPGAAAKLLAQDKLHARHRFAQLGYPVPPFAHARTQDAVVAFAAEHGWPLIGKAPRGGYDGRGVFVLDDAAAAARVLALQPDGLVLEPHLPIVRELAIVVARSATGERVAYPVAETVQRDAMCREVLVPAEVEAPLAARVRDLALRLADDAQVTGLLAVELFQTPDALLVNEVALRPHNSGHYTIEGCATSQFEQHLRAVLGWPLGLATQLAPAVATVNVVGPADGSDPTTRLRRALAVPGAHVHLYGKTPAPGRKLGHVTVLGDELEAARRSAREAASLLEGDG